MSARMIVRGADGVSRPLALGRLIHKGGGAGRIHAVAGDPLTVVKLYHDVDIARGYAPKIAAMLERPPVLPAIEDGGRRYVQVAWPQGMVTDGDGRFRGFTMPHVDLDRAAPLDAMLVKALRQRHGLPENYAFRVFAARNVAAAVAALHARGHHIIDLKPQNLSIYRDTMYVAVLDCDGLSIDGGGRRFPAHQFTDGYRAPEAVTKHLAPEELGEGQDRFALAVVLFQLLNSGIHPFQGVPVRKGDTLGTAQDRIDAGLYAYASRGNGRQGPSPASLHDRFEDATLELFRRAFDSQYRPTSAEWRDHLRGLVEDGVLERCADQPETHAHFSKGCGLCAAEAEAAKRLAAARRRPRPARRTRPATIIPTGRNAPQVRWPWNTPRRPAATPAAILAGLRPLARRALHALRTTVLGGGGPLPALRPADRLSLLLLSGTYIVFAINLVVAAALVASMVMRRDFHAFADLVADWGLVGVPEGARASAKLLVLQSKAMVFVMAATACAGAVCYGLTKNKPGTIIVSHAQWLVRTLWMAPLGGLAALALASITWPWGFVFILALPPWVAYRCLKGIVLLLRSRPLAAPHALV